jgi:hypothetical protein
LEVDWTGTPAIDLGPTKAGEQVAMRGASFMTIADGKLTRIVDPKLIHAIIIDLGSASALPISRSFSGELQSFRLRHHQAMLFS